MGKIIKLHTKTDERGALTVLEKILPFEIKRIYYIYNLQKGTTRGGHRHKETIQALICLSHSCEVYINDGIKKYTVTLSKPTECLILLPEDWHLIKNYDESTIILVLSSHFFNPDDYIYEEYA